MPQTNKPPVWVRFVTFLISLVLFFSVAAALFIGNVQIITDKDNMSAIIREALFDRFTIQPARSGGNGNGTAATVRIHSRMAMPRVKLDEDQPSSDASEALVEWMYNIVMEQFSGELDASLEDVQAFVDESTLKDEIANLSASLISDFYTGENTTDLSADTITALLEENAALIEKHFNLTLTGEDIATISKTIEENGYIAQIQEQGVANMLISAMAGGTAGSSGTGGTPDSSDTGSANLVQTVTSALNTFRSYTSTGALLICVAVSILCIAAILALNWKWLARGLYNSGMPLFLVSLPSAALCLYVLFMGSSWDALFADISSSVGAAAKIAIRLIAPASLGVFATGAVLLISAIVVKVLTGRKQQTETVTEAFSGVLIDEEPQVETITDISDSTIV